MPVAAGRVIVMMKCSSLQAEPRIPSHGPVEEEEAEAGAAVSTEMTSAPLAIWDLADIWRLTIAGNSPTITA
jgi:hypothetical protein